MVVISGSLTAKKSAITGKRNMSLSYSISDHESFDESINGAEFAMYIPISKRLEVGFGSNQNWVEEKTDTETHSYREYSFYTNLKFHFLPNSIINPFIMVEMGNVVTDLEINALSQENTDETVAVSNNNKEGKGLLFAADQELKSSDTDINFYYSGSIGEEFLITDKLSFLSFYTTGGYAEESFQSLTASLGYWVLEDFFINFKYKTFFNSTLSNYNLVGNIRF